MGQFLVRSVVGGDGGQSNATGCRVAIVGLGAVLPDAWNVSAFASACERGTVAIRAPREGARFSIGAYPSLSAGGFVTDAWQFDWRRFQTPPKDVTIVNPLSFATLTAGTEALEGVRALPRDRTAIVLGATGLGYQRDSALRIHLDEMVRAVRDAAIPSDHARLDEAIRVAISALEGRIHESSSDNVVGSLASVSAARLAMHFDLHGPHYALDADHASALVAMQAAVRGLEQHEWDCVVTGGVSELLTPLEHAAYAAMGAISQRGEVRPFDPAADGTLLGEGVVLFALKRLDDAIRDGDTIHALIEGIGTSQGPATTHHVELALRAALTRAGARVDEVAHIECAAAAIPSLDAGETHALANVFAEVPRSVSVGAACASVGHTRAASGAVSVLRAILALRDRRALAQPGITETLRLADRLHVAGRGESEPWDAGRLVGVSSISMEGLAAHVLLRDATNLEDLARSEMRARPASVPIAIIGHGGVFADAADARGLFENLLAARDSVTSVPSARWDVGYYGGAEPHELQRSYASHGSFVDIGVRSASDPTHDLTARSTKQALVSAWRDLAEEARRAEVFVGYMPFVGVKWAADAAVWFEEWASDLSRACEAAGIDEAVSSRWIADGRERFRASRPEVSDRSLRGWLASSMAARARERVDAHGPAIAIESACASTFAAFHAATMSLREGACDLAIAGAGFADLAPEFYVGCSRFKGLSPTGIAPFDESASGFVPGEGAGMFVLKRLADAERDGDHIFAVIRGIGGSSDGAGRSVLTPSAVGEALAMTRALAAAGISPNDVGYLECHGTGTAIGDATEAEAIRAAYGGSTRERPLPVGSVKSNLGHLCAASGVPATTKLLLALANETVPPTLHYRRPSAKIDLASCRIEPVVRPRAWRRSTPEQLRIGAMSAFGLGGSNFHVILSEHRASHDAHRAAEVPRNPVIDPVRGSELFAVCAGSLPDALGALGSLHESVTADPSRLRRIAAVSRQTAAMRRGHARMAVTASSPEELGSKLEWLARGVRDPSLERPLRAMGIFLSHREEEAPRGSLVLLFPGQGPEYAGMMLDAAQQWPLLELYVARADAVCRAVTGRALRPAIRGTNADTPIHFEDLHAAVLTVSCAISGLLESYGIRPDVVVGQSAGELAALVAGGVLTFEDALRAMHARSRAVLDIDGDDVGAMAVLQCGAGQLETISRELPWPIYLAADNCPHACLAAGARPAIEALCRASKELGIEASYLEGYRGYHSPLIAAAKPAYRAALETLTYSAPTCEVMSTVDLTSYDPDRTRTIDRLVEQYVTPARFHGAIRTLHERGSRLFIECGPKRPLSAYVEDTLRGEAFACHASIHPKTGEVESIQRILGFAFVMGVGSPIPVSTPENVRKTMTAQAKNQSEDRFNVIARYIVTALAERTGYPEDMLELDADLEGDLGIDTVKQAEAFSRTRKHFGLPPARDVRMRDYNTLRKVIRYFMEQTARGEVTSAPALERPRTEAPASEIPKSSAPRPHRASAVVPATRAAHAVANRRTSIEVVESREDFLQADIVFEGASHGSSARRGTDPRLSSPAVWDALRTVAERLVGGELTVGVDLVQYIPVPLAEDERTSIVLTAEISGDRVVARATHTDRVGGDVVSHEATFRREARAPRGLSARLEQRLDARGYLDGLRPLSTNAPGIIRVGDAAPGHTWACEVSFVEAIGGVLPQGTDGVRTPAAVVEGALSVMSLAFGGHVGGAFAIVESLGEITFGEMPSTAETLHCYIVVREFERDAIAADIRVLTSSRHPVLEIEHARLISAERAGWPECIADLQPDYRAESYVGRTAS